MFLWLCPSHTRYSNLDALSFQRSYWSSIAIRNLKFFKTTFPLFGFFVLEFVVDPNWKLKVPFWSRLNVRKMSKIFKLNSFFDQYVLVLFAKNPKNDYDSVDVLCRQKFLPEVYQFTGDDFPEIFRPVTTLKTGRFSSGLKCRDTSRTKTARATWRPRSYVLIEPVN